ncbi:MAG: hypothetical protein ACE5LX_04605 [Nitrospinota bacterium]
MAEGGKVFCRVCGKEVMSPAVHRQLLEAIEEGLKEEDFSIEQARDSLSLCPAHRMERMGRLISSATRGPLCEPHPSGERAP